MKTIQPLDLNAVNVVNLFAWALLLIANVVCPATTIAAEGGAKPNVGRKSSYQGGTPKRQSTYIALWSTLGRKRTELTHKWANTKNGLVANKISLQVDEIEGQIKYLKEYQFVVTHWQGRVASVYGDGSIVVALGAAKFTLKGCPTEGDFKERLRNGTALIFSGTVQGESSLTLGGATREPELSVDCSEVARTTRSSGPMPPIEDGPFQQPWTVDPEKFQLVQQLKGLVGTPYYQSRERLDGEYGEPNQVFNNMVFAAWYYSKGDFTVTMSLRNGEIVTVEAGKHP